MHPLQRARAPTPRCIAGIAFLAVHSACSVSVDERLIMACDLLFQRGCESGEACDTLFTPDGATTCRAVNASGTELDPCTGRTACAGGYACLGEGNWRRCKPFCASDGDCFGSGSRCLTVRSGDVEVANTRFCTAACDPLADTPAGCPEGWQCGAYYDGATGVSYTECIRPGTQALDGPCDSSADCGAGLRCVYFGAENKCLQECRVTLPVSECPEGRTCSSYADPVVVGGAEYGYCR